MANNPFRKAINSALSQISPDCIASTGIPIEALLDQVPKAYTIYTPLLLLPAHTFAASSWTCLLATMDAHDRTVFFSKVAEDLQVTHVALNAPIMLTTTPRFQAVKDGTSEFSCDQAENIQRRPNITPIYGAFPSFLATSSPSPADFTSALWVSTRQNGITQIWAPQYTMFSRGNITEKARLLSLPTLASAVTDEHGCTAVDLFAGIGYFVFSYARAGCQKVLGFELNPWSVEGLRRGAKANNWSCSILAWNDGDAYEHASWDYSSVELGSRLNIVQCSNSNAARMVQRNRARLPPVRHVNLGLLPTSAGAYEIALRCLDPVLGGWLHIHENFAIKEINTKAEEVLQTIKELTCVLEGSSVAEVKMEHIERVKTYAPGVMHCVLDIHVYREIKIPNSS